MNFTKKNSSKPEKNQGFHADSEDRKTWICGISAVLLWSTVATAFKLALAHLSVFELLFWANLFSVICFLSWSAYKGKLKSLLQIGLKDFRRSLLLGILNPLIYYCILFSAYDLLPAQVAQPLNYTWAITLSLLSVPILKKKLSKFDIIGGLIAYLGVWVICTKGVFSFASGLSIPGILLSLGSTIIWALYWLLLAKDKRDTTEVLATSSLLALPFTFLVAFFTGMSMPSIQGITGGIYVGLFEMGITFILWGNAVKYAKHTAKIATLIFLSPFLSLVFINFILKEQIAVSSIVGLVVIVIGLLIQKSRDRNRK